MATEWLVRPRVVLPGVGGVRLDRALEGLLGAGAVVAITGGPGSGKTSSLAYIRGTFAGQAVPALLDEPDFADVRAAVGSCPVVYTAAAPHEIRHSAVLKLAPWSEDDLAEYLLAARRDRVASVMQRIARMKDKDELGGCPELWAPALLAMADDDALCTVGQVLAAVRTSLPAQGISAVRNACLRWFVRREERWPGRADPVLLRHARHPLVRCALAAEALVDRIAAGNLRVLGTGLMDPALLRHAGTLLAGRPEARTALESWLQRHAAKRAAPAVLSLLRAADADWRPEDGEAVNLSQARLDRARWAGVNVEIVAGSYLSMRGADLSHAQIHRPRLWRATLSGAKLSDAKVRSARMIACDLSGADLSRAELAEGEWEDLLLAHADLRQAHFRDMVLRGCDLRDANFELAVLKRTRLERCTLDGSDFGTASGSDLGLFDMDLRTVNLNGCGFKYVSIVRCNLAGMRLRRSTLGQAELDAVDLTGADLTRADMAGARLKGCGLADVWMEDTDLHDSDLRGSTFHMGSSRSGLVFSGIPCEGSRTGFYSEDLAQQDYKRPEEIRKANLCGANLHGARIDGVDFYLVDLRGARYSREQAEWFKKCGAILHDP